MCLCTILVNNQIVSVFKDVPCTILVKTHIVSVFKDVPLYNFSQQPDFFCVQGHSPAQFYLTIGIFRVYRDML